MSSDRYRGLQPAAQSAASLRGTGAASGGSGTPLESPARASAALPSLAQRASALHAAEQGKPAPATCRQWLYVSFFFDGTGNNLKADLPTRQQSNVARLFRAMPLDDSAQGVFTRYIPGIGTFFPEVNDDGRGAIPFVDHHKGMGAKGQARLDFAFSELEKIIKQAEARAMNPSNKIVQIKLAVFGFSRGATLARAFVRDLLSARLRKTFVQGTDVFWSHGRYPLSIEFMGLWDSVAAVGVPMSANNVRAFRSGRRTSGNVARSVVDGLLRTPPQLLRAVDLAFGTPGADPSPGSADGHGAWAEGLTIPAAVKQCLQMVAAHEVRNSFPVDSLQRGNTRTANCREMVYPGSHSDVGGGYRSGEGGKGVAAQSGEISEEVRLMLSLIPLHAMHQQAVAAGVPVRTKGSSNWTKDNIDDFDVSPTLVDRFNHYMTQAGWGGRPLGQQILAHTRLYFSWRWYRIANGRSAENVRLKSNEQIFAHDRQSLDRQRAQMQRQRASANLQLLDAIQQRNNAVQAEWMVPKTNLPAGQSQLAASNEKIRLAQAQVDRCDLQMKEVQARLDGTASDGDIPGNLSEYDAELCDDAQSILAAIRQEPGKRSQLRPHYRNLIETYEDQFVKGRGLMDEKVIAFFDDHVHDSLAGFSRDSTLPSDPRVVYVGANVKYEYARAEPAEETERAV